MKKIIFYTRNQCELCLDAKNLLILLQSEYSFQIDERDIETNDEWIEKYGLIIPVIELNGEIIQSGIIDMLDLEKSLKQR
ncbi:glutaredoxin family protein [Bacillus niameyensis]|uniref:glutaredoxin family protein n=1 Tax=Bacillus niameyensis TaxID=1522308 RepID=UPI000784BD26|nr:glutaredoxin family protein [Bacillus niameyensis]